MFNYSGIPNNSKINNMEQTAVSWLMEKLKFIDKNAYGILYNESFEQAKDMEKQQIEDAFNSGLAYDYDDSETYYNKIYNK
jgi:hypothetical protein